jgi:acyl-coenzyme A synthetase/AMP-(fatty) acid ligase/acyl carrier protein
MRARAITIQHMVPTLFRRMAEALQPGEQFESLRVLRLGGERVDGSDVDLFRRTCPPDAGLLLGLASTESVSIFVQWWADEAARADGPRVPVGRANPGFKITIVGDDGRPAPDGEVGELVLTSRYIGLGYWNEPELTARVFAVDPADPEVRSFRTGDFGRRRPDGLLEFHGRADHQIKLHGHRIELGEIESALRRCAGVRDAGAVVRTDAGGSLRAIVAYAELIPGAGAILPRHLMAMATRHLPPAMMPAAIVILEALPRLPNLKIDRLRLAALDAARALLPSDRADDPLLDEVAGIFETVLGIGNATPEDSLPSLGGDSLQAVEIMAEIEARFGLVVPEDIFAARSNIRDVASWIASEQTSRHRRRVAG